MKVMTNLTMIGKIFDMAKNIQHVKNNGDMLPKDDPVKAFVMLSALVVEVGETLQEDKRWKSLVGDTRVHINNKENKIEELADVFIYLINAVLYSNVDADEFVEIVLAKMELVYNNALDEEEGR